MVYGCCNAMEIDTDDQVYEVCLTKKIEMVGVVSLERHSTGRGFCAPMRQASVMLCRAACVTPVAAIYLGIRLYQNEMKVNEDERCASFDSTRRTNLTDSVLTIYQVDITLIALALTNSRIQKCCSKENCGRFGLKTAFTVFYSNNNSIVQNML